MNREQLKEYHRRYSKQWSKLHPEERAASSRKYYAAHIEQQRAHRRQYHETHIEQEKARHKIYQKNHPDRMRELVRISAWRKLGLDIEQAQTLWNSVNHCQICGKSIAGLTKHLDHDHVTKRIRGILCRNCNRALGNFYDNPEICDKAAEYLRMGQRWTG